MRKSYGMMALLVLALLLGLLLAAAPAALATATFTEFTATSTWTAEPNPPDVYRVTGGVAHMEFGNTFAVTSSSALGNWFTTTHVYAVAKLVDGLPGDAVIWGTFESVGDAGDMEGTFTGTMSMATGTWNIKGRGKVVSGDMSGALIHVTEVNPGTLTWPVTITMLDPHGS